MAQSIEGIHNSLEGQDMHRMSLEWYIIGVIWRTRQHRQTHG